MPPDKPLTIGLARNFAIGIPYWTIVEHGARERARELGVTLTVHHSVTGIEQAAAIHSLVQQQVAAIIVAAIYPNDPAFVAALDAAATAGIPLVAADVAVPRLVDCLVRSDDVQGAATGAAYLAECLGGRGKVVHLQGMLTNPVAQLRSVGVHQVLDRFPDIQIVVETDRGSWSHAATLPLMHEVLAAHPDIDGVFAANDPMALGALEAIAEVGRQGQVVVIGVDGDPDALLALHEGALAATVRRSPYLMGRTVVETALQVIQGIPVPSEVLLNDMVLITAETVSRAAFESLRIMRGVIDELIDSSMTLAAERTMLRTIIDSLPDPIYVKDRDSHFEVANQATAQLMGTSHPDALIGKTDFDFFPHELATQYYADEQAVIQSGAPLLNKEELVVEPSGEQRWLVTTKVPLRNPQGAVVRLVGRGQDITERKRAEEERRSLERKLLETQKLESLGVLAGGIAHDFNNLLVAILGNASLTLLNLPPEAPARRALEQIETAAQRAADLTRQLLAYAGKGRFVVQRLNINAIVEEMTHLLHASIPKNVVLRYHLAAELPTVEADATQIRQIVMNLVVNAAEAIEGVQGIISITTGVQWADRAYLSEVYLASDLPEGPYVFIEVADTGRGMDAATRAKIFEPFFTTKFTGRGLGLAAVLGIVRGHKGALKVCSEPGQGSTFRILLPGTTSAVEPNATVSSPGIIWHGKGTVLVIDDEPDVCIVATRMLQQLGFTGLIANDGATGIELFRAHAGSIVCVLLDMTMPQLDGQETFRLIRQIKPDARVVLMSGYNEQEVISRFAGKGIAAFLPKPFTPSDLRAKLQSVLNTQERPN